MRCLILLFCLTIYFHGLSQEIDTLSAEGSQPLMEADTLISDSTRADSVVQSTPTSKRSDIETTINYNANDSIFFNIKSRELFMYGDTHIDYGSIALDAERTDVDWNKRTLKARYVTDSTGKK